MPKTTTSGQTLDPCETEEVGEAAMIDEIVATMRTTVRKRYGDGPQLRGAHAKSHGMYRGTLTVAADLPEHLRHGVFAEGRSFDVWLRGSSTPDMALPDRVPNVRGLAVKLRGVAGERLTDTAEPDAQDFVFINAAVVPFGTVRSFRDMLVYAAEGTGLRWFTGGEGKARAEITHDILGVPPNLLGQTFHSSVPYKLGPHVVKLRLRPAHAVDNTDEHPTEHLLVASRRWLGDKPVRLELAVQRQVDPARQPVEDASVEWAEAECPFEVVATLDLPPQSLELVGADEYAENLRFDPWNCIEAHRPVGGLNRVRRAAYAAMAAARLRSRAPVIATADCLPADDPDPATRAAELAGAAEKFQPDAQKLPPLVMCAGVPDAARPGLSWTLTAAKVSSRIGLNVLANKVEAHRADHGLLASAPFMAAAELERKAAEEFEKVVEGALVAFEARADRLPPELPAHEVLTEIVDKRLRGVLGAGTGEALVVFESSSPLYLYQSPDPEKRATSLDQHRSLFRELPLSPAHDDALDDSAFTRRRLTGANAPCLARTTHLPTGFPLDDATLAAATTAGDTVRRAADEGRLFGLDHRALAGLERKCASDGTPMQLYTPFSLFAVPPDGGRLRPVAIQVAPEGALATPRDGWRWTMARYAVESADMVYYEPITHLARTHLVAEPVALATFRHLSTRHPIFKLLAPHVEGTISVNDMAVNHLLADFGAIDQTFAATMPAIRGAAAAAVQAFDLRADTLPKWLGRQGLDDRSVLPVHPWRDDALRVHAAIGRWVSAYVANAYRDEAALQADPELRNWAAALGQPVTAGGVGGFGVVQTRADLVTVLTELVYIPSAGHAAVNFPQWTDSSFAPTSAGAGWAPPGEAPDEAAWLRMTPPLRRAELHAEFLYLLGTLYHSRLGNYQNPNGVREPWFADRVVLESLLPAVQADLREVEAQIAAANADGTRERPYVHLLPSRVPQSINV